MKVFKASLSYQNMDDKSYLLNYLQATYLIIAVSLLAITWNLSTKLYAQTYNLNDKRSSFTIAGGRMSTSNYILNGALIPISGYSEGGGYRLYGGIITSIADEDLISLLILPENFSLSQNYPNPFNPVTVLRYALPKSGHVSLIIYNLQGQELMRWDEQNVQPGYYEITWDGTNKFGVPVGSGVYLYRLVAADFIQTKKMILLK